MKKTHVIVLFSVLLIALCAYALRALGGQFIGAISEEAHLSIASTTRALIAAPAPNFSLPDRFGTSTTLRALTGKPIVLVFFATWVPGALDQVRILDAAKLPEDVLLYAIDHQEDRKTALTVLERAGYSLPVLFDETGVVGGAYGVRNLPTTFFIDRKGTIRDKVVGVLSEDMLASPLAIILKE